MKTEKANKELFINSLEGIQSSNDLSEELSRLILYRKSEFTISEIAKISGKSESTIKRFEQGKVDSMFLFELYREKFKNRQ